MSKSFARGVIIVAAIQCFAVLQVGCGPSQEARRKQAESSQKLAYAFLQEKQPARALVELGKAEAAMPADPEIKNSMGLAFWAKREYVLAEKKFIEAVALDENYSEAWNNLGAFYIDQAQYDKAVSALKKALANILYPTSERALANMGWALYKLGKLEEAKKSLTEATEIAPNFALAQKNLGMVLQEMGDNPGAVDRFDRVLKIYSLDQETHFSKAVSLLRQNDRAQARVSFEEAWKLGPTTDIGKSARNYLDLLK